MAIDPEDILNAGITGVEAILSGPSEPEPGMTVRDFIVEVLKFFVLALVIVLPIRAYVAQPFVVSGRSMVPTFEDGQYLIIDELSYRFREPSRGEVIIFKYPLDPSKFFIKRLIGLPGETVSIENGVVSITEVGGKKITLDQSYVKNSRADSEMRILGDDEYWVMGDNRAESSDSRSWGTITREHIVGGALIRLFPIQTISLLPGKFDYK